MNRDCVVLSLKGVGDVTSSFVNAGLVSLLGDFDFDFIKTHLSVVDSNNQINEMIHRCFKNALRQPVAA